MKTAFGKMGISCVADALTLSSNLIAFFNEQDVPLLAGTHLPRFQTRTCSKGLPYLKYVQ